MRLSTRRRPHDRQVVVNASVFAPQSCCSESPRVSASIFQTRSVADRRPLCLGVRHCTKHSSHHRTLRYIGFYAGRLYSLLAASVVPVILLVEASRLYGRLDEALAVAEERSAEFERSREELAQTQRLEAIGKLTGGGSHTISTISSPSSWAISSRYCTCEVTLKKSSA